MYSVGELQHFKVEYNHILSSQFSKQQLAKYEHSTNIWCSKFKSNLLSDIY